MPRQASPEEEELRQAVEAWMRQRWPAARIIHELVLDDGRVRIDLASVGDEELRLIEIKSAKDVLKRLPTQVRVAHRCAQEVWVAIDAKHAEKLEALETEQARAGDGMWTTGVLIYRDGKLSEKRQAANQQPDPRRVVGLLWSDEMRTHLLASNNQVNMIRLAVNEYGLRHIMRKVCIALKARPFPRADKAIGPAPATRFPTKGAA